MIIFNLFVISIFTDFVINIFLKKKRKKNIDNENYLKNLFIIYLLITDPGLNIREYRYNQQDIAR